MAPMTISDDGTRITRMASVTPAVSDADFSFAWAVGSQEWEKARRIVARHERGSDYDLAWSAVEELLVGTIRFGRHGRVPLPVPSLPFPLAATGVWRENGPPA